MKHFKNSQQINYSTDRGSSYADRERNSPRFLLHISQMLNVSTFGNTADIYTIVHLVPHACQNITVDQSHSSRYGCENLEISGEWRHKDSVLKSGDRGGHRINASSFFLCVLSTFVTSFDRDTLARLCREPESRLVERCNHYCLHSIMASASFLTCFKDL